MSTIVKFDAIRRYHMYAQLRALDLEIKGIKFKASVYAHIKRTYNLKGSRKKVRDQFAELIGEDV